MLWPPGMIATATLLGSATLTLLAGVSAGRAPVKTLLSGAAVLMTLTGVGFATIGNFWPLVLIAFVGTLNPSSGDVSVFLPLEQAELAGVVSKRDRTRQFARYTRWCSLTCRPMCAWSSRHLLRA